MLIGLSVKEKASTSQIEERLTQVNEACYCHYQWLDMAAYTQGRLEEYISVNVKSLNNLWNNLYILI